MFIFQETAFKITSEELRSIKDHVNVFFTVSILHSYWNKILN